MFKKVVWKYIGKVLIGLSLLFIFPIIVSLIYHESIIPFLIPLLMSLTLGLLLNLLKANEKNIFSKDGFNIVALSWIIVSLIVALPFYINKDAGYVDSLFEAVSGLTTTGATIFKDVEVLNKGILFWRSFSHFIGGMGVLTFVMAIIPLSRRDNSLHVLKAEMPGPSVAKIVPSTKKMLLYLYSIYLGLTFIEVVLLLLGKMDFFDSLLISMGTAGTGGFSILNTSLAIYSSFCKYVVAIFMFLFGVNFNVYFLIIMKDIKNALNSEELKVYIGIFIFSVLFIILNTYSMFDNIGEVIMESIFHVSSIMTSTGYSIGDINIYPTCCQILFLVLMLISACAGSTCGGFKITRLIIIAKTIKKDIQQVIYPQRVKTIKLEGRKVEEEVVHNTCTFMFLYFIIIVLLIFLVSFDGFSLQDNINAVFTTFGNVGLCFGISDFSIFSSFSKIFLTIGMLLGRLEIFPIIVFFSSYKKYS